MALTKAEKEAHQAKYEACVAKARDALERGHPQDVVHHAVTSLPFVDGMMQYERQYRGTEFTSIESIDLVLKLAPVLFDFVSLEKVAKLLKEQRRIDKNVSVDIADSLSKAHDLMWDAHRFWKHLESTPSARQDKICDVLGGSQERWQSITEVWVHAGLVLRSDDGGSYTLLLDTRLDTHAFGKCPSCGAIGKARKSRLIVNTNCPRCGNGNRFVIPAGTQAFG